MDPSLTFTPLIGFPEIEPGSDLASLVVRIAGPHLVAGDILVVTHKVISKAEGRRVALAEVEPRPEALTFARAWGKDARQVEVVLRESAEVLRMQRGVIISRTRHGLVCANAGVDRSNCPVGTVCLLPDDPDRSARDLYSALRGKLGFAVPVLVCDSFGRAWRQGIVNLAIGLAGMSAFTDHRGRHDSHGYLMEASLMASADALCAAAELVMGKTDGVPVVRVRGFVYQPDTKASAFQLVRPLAEDFFA